VSASRSGEHQELLERFQAEVSERFAASGALTAGPAISNAREAIEQAPYAVGIPGGRCAEAKATMWLRTVMEKTPSEQHKCDRGFKFWVSVNEQPCFGVA
jgi:hypothetical protein